MAEQDPLVSFRLGAVRAGIQATLLTLLLLITFRATPGHGSVPTVPYAMVIVAATTGIFTVWRLPWRRLFTSKLGIRTLYTWSVLDILLITFAVGFTGSGDSELYLLYCLTTVFFGAVYPQRGQVGLLIFTWACYLSVLVATGWKVGTAIVVFRISVLGIVATLVSFLATELLHHIASLQEARGTAERWAGLLSTVADSTRQMTLDRDPALEGLLSSALELGFDGAGIVGYDHEAGTFRVTHHRGFPDDYVSGIHPASGDLPGLVRMEGRTTIADEVRPLPGRLTLPLQEAGFRALVACPIWVDGWLNGALIGGTRTSAALSRQEVEAFELLSIHIGLAMENAQRFEETLQMVERLEELDQLKDDFLATASHEIRTPLTVIVGSGLTLEQRWEELDEPVRRELLMSVNRNARTLDDLVRSLLDFARLGADSQRVDSRLCSANDLVESVTGRLRPLFAERPLTTVADREMGVMGDPDLLERVLENLLSNASKHTPAGTHVRVSAMADGNTVVLAVEDDGPGIQEEDVRHLGERFYRGGDANTRSTKGLGLGLALVREILELHGTVLEIESAPGYGARFAFRLPAAPLGDSVARPSGLARPSTRT